MELSLDLIKAAGATVGAPVKRDIEWRSGGKEHKAHVFVRLSSYETALSEFEMASAGKEALVARVVSSVVDSKGKPIFSAEDITGDPETGDGKMCSSLFLALISAVNDANGFSGDAEKNSQTPTPSGTSSSSPASEGEQ